jgi:CRISPR-associated endonuclease Cas2
MALFFVAYDLDRPGQKYQDLWDELESLGAKRVQDSVWALKSNEKTVDLRNTLRQHIDENDRLLVIKASFWASRKSMFDITKL